MPSRRRAVLVIGFMLCAGACSGGDSLVMPDDGAFVGSAVSFTVSGDQVTDFSFHLNCAEGTSTSTIDFDPPSFADPIEDGEFGFTLTGTGLYLAVSGEFVSNSRAEGEYTCGDNEETWTATRE